MKVVETANLLTNFEVLQHVKESKSTSKAENLQTIVVELLAYLRERPAGNVANPQTAENLKRFVQEIESANLQLENAEIVQIINSAPVSMPVLFCLIEEADTRFTEQQLEFLLELSQKYLGEEPVPGEEQ